MAIRWKEYKSRRKLDLKKWSKNIGIKNYSDLNKHLWGVGVIPPERIHEDVVTILGDVDDSPILKPTSGRSTLEEISESVSDSRSEHSTLKPSSGRKIKKVSTDKVEKSSTLSKPKRTRRKRSASKRKTPITKKSTSKA